MYDATVDHRFSPHKPAPEQVTAALLRAARAVDNYCPDGREKTIALNKLEAAHLYAAASTRGL